MNTNTPNPLADAKPGDKVTVRGRRYTITDIDSWHDGIPAYYITGPYVCLTPDYSSASKMVGRDGTNGRFAAERRKNLRPIFIRYCKVTLEPRIPKERV